MEHSFQIQLLVIIKIIKTIRTDSLLTSRLWTKYIVYFFQDTKKWSEIKLLLRDFVSSAAWRWIALALHSQTSQSACAKSIIHFFDIYTNDYIDKINDDNNKKRRSIKQQCSQIKFFKKCDLLHDPTSNNVTSIPTNVIKILL